MNHDLRPGAEPVKGYVLIERLGKGGFGEVWKATGPGGFQVALKFVALDENAGPVELRALEVIKDIRHPHLLGTFGSWQDNGQLIIAMELAERTLLDRFRESAGQGFPGIPAPEIFEHFLDAAQALDYLNEPRHPGGAKGPQGIQHRDVKPQNLLLVGGSVKVADFGLARVLENSTTGHTGSMTPSYAAPEFFDRRTSSQSDQYSLAVTYCHLRGGRLPFTGNAAAVMAGHLMREPDLSMILEAERPALARALSKSPRDRWPSCRVFIQTVIDSAKGRTVGPVTATIDASPPAGSLESTADAMFRPSESSQVINLHPARHRKRRRSAYMLGAWALAPMSLLLAAVLLLRADKPEAIVDSRKPAPSPPAIKHFERKDAKKSPANESKTEERPPSPASTAPESSGTDPRPVVEPGSEDGFGLARFGNGDEEVRGVKVQVGDPQFTLLWDSVADLDIHVMEPGGKEIFWNDRKGNQGGELDVDNMDGHGPENIYWLKQNPDGTKELGPGPPGEYKWFVHYYGGNGGTPVATRWKVRIKHEGKVEIFQGRLSVQGARSKIYTLTVGGVDGQAGGKTPDFKP